MKIICIISLTIFTVLIIQSCATLDKTAEEKKEVETAVVDEKLMKGVQELKQFLATNLKMPVLSMKRN